MGARREVLIAAVIAGGLDFDGSMTRKPRIS
jgi:hypothetical protein